MCFFVISRVYKSAYFEKLFNYEKAESIRY